VTDPALSEAIGPTAGVPGGEGAGGSAPSFGRALGQRPFFLLWLSQLISQSGDFIFDVALIWLVLTTTGSVFAVGVVVTAALVPVVVLGPFLGVYIDRWPRRTLLIGTNVAEGALVAVLSGLILAHAASLAAIVAVVLALGAGGQIVRLTTSAMVPQTVGVDDLGPANGLLSISGSSTQVVGLSIGGIVVALFGVELPITYDALTFFAAAVIVGLMAAAVGRPEPPAAGSTRSFWSEFSEGFRYFAGQRYLLELLAVGIVVNFCANAAFALWAPYADLVLHGGAATYGFLGAAIALGAIVGAVVVGKIRLRRRLGPVLFAGTATVGAMIVALGLTRSIPLALGESFGVGILLSVVNVPLLAAVQAKVPPRLMGRVMAVLMSLILVAAPLGAFFAGSIAVATSIAFVYVLAGAIILAMVGIGWATLAEVRRLGY
jgi:MFS transporter, DHA3 family, macrolide efflux protein